MTSSAFSSPPSLNQTLLGARDALFIPNASDKFDPFDPFVGPKEYIGSTPVSASPSSQFDDPFLALDGHLCNNFLDDEACFRLEDYLAQSPAASESQPSFGEKENRGNLVIEAPAPTPAAMAPATTTLITDGLQIRVFGAPDKSRVETQTRLCIQLLTANGTKVTHWPYLKLPERLLSRSRLKRAAQRSSVGPSEEISNDSNLNHPVLYLDAKVICTSQPDQPVKVCQGCIQRERKRAERSKNDHRLLIDTIPEQDRILLFNCGPVVNFSSGDAILPTRIACYCRHHNEKVGFSVQFSLKNDHGDVIATGASSPILITDDHKSSRQKGRKRGRADSDDDGGSTAKTVYEKHRLITPANSRRGSLSPTAANQEAMTPSLPTPSEERCLSSLLGDGNTVAQAQVHPLIRTTLPPMTPPPSGSPCISPDALITSPTFLHSRSSSSTSSSSTSSNSSSSSTPQLERLIPAQGPTYGGVEVTVLGSGFYRGLTCVFGEHQATTVYWSPNTMVCILPPTASPGPVVVSFKEHSLILDGQGVPLFTYYNANEQGLLEMALQVFGLKMTGTIHDAKYIAMRIVQGGTSISTSGEPPVDPTGKSSRPINNTLINNSAPTTPSSVSLAPTAPAETQPPLPNMGRHSIAALRQQPSIPSPL